MITAWTQRLTDPQEKDQYIKSLRNSKWVLEDLSKILTAMEKGIDRQELSPSQYDNPNWAYRNAHASGFRQCLNQIQYLIALDHKEQDDRQPIRTTPDRPAGN